MNPASRRGSLLCGLGLERGAALEWRVRFQLHRPAEAGDQRRMVGPDLRAPGAIALFQPQRLDGAVAGVGDAVRLPGGHQRVVDAQRKLDRNVQLAAELADIGDPQRKDRRAGER